MKQRTLPKPVAKTAVYVAVAAVVPLACVVVFAVWLRWPWPTATTLALAVGFVCGLILGDRRADLETAGLHERFDAYRLADARTDLDTVGPVSGETPVLPVGLNVADYHSVVVESSGARPVVMTGTRDVEAQDRELSDVYDIPEWQHSGERAITERCACGVLGNVRLRNGTVQCHRCCLSGLPAREVRL